jgi:hypothetical protein
MRGCLADRDDNNAIESVTVREHKAAERNQRKKTILTTKVTKITKFTQLDGAQSALCAV